MGSFHRSATFINSRFAVTSAHVVQGHLEYNPIFDVFDGTNYKTNIGSGIRVIKVIIHPDYVPGSNTVPDIALLEFTNPFQPSVDQIFGSATPGQRVLSAGFGNWGTPATGEARDGNLRGWNAFVSTSSFGFSPRYYQATDFGQERRPGLFLNGRGASYDSGGPVYNELGHVIGINDSATIALADVGITIYMRLDSVKPWLEATMAAAAKNHLPQLACQRTPSGCSVSWGADATGWTLQKSNQLSGWSTVGATISTSGSYTHSGIETSQFFRLVKP